MKPISLASCLLLGILAGSPLLAAAPPAGAPGPAAPSPEPAQGDFTIRNFQFRSGESLPELRLHYTTLGQPHRSGGVVDNAVLILHGTGGSGAQFLNQHFAGELFGPGQPLDSSRYFIILPDNIGHGHSSKPSDGLRAKFPHYDYDDMVAAQHRLLTEGLKVNHLRLIMGTSMGCMHAWVWGESHPEFADALMPLACLPVAIAGRNRVWRDLVITAITSDPDWQGGNYTAEPARALRNAAGMLMIAGSAPIPMQKNYPTREAADAYVQEALTRNLTNLDANDLLYQVSASRNYDPSAQLERVQVPVMWINSADDFINPPELGIAERESKRLKRGRFILLPASEATHGHGTHTWAALWKSHLLELLSESRR